MQKWVRWALGAAIVVLAAAPVVRSPADDSFPLSTYPMFSLARPQETTVSSAAGFDAAGTRLRLSPRVVGGTGEVIQAAGTVGQAIGAGTTDDLCREVLAEAPDDVVAVEIVTETYDVIAYFDGDEEPLERVVHSRCES
ncbi:MAG: hypothetical protein KJO97_09065 [Acidimicrobiia bacterium]|nr:hypothetical protein [Acidimicrobiia bacterium]